MDDPVETTKVRQNMLIVFLSSLLPLLPRSWKNTCFSRLDKIQAHDSRQEVAERAYYLDSLHNIHQLRFSCKCSNPQHKHMSVLEVTHLHHFKHIEVGHLLPELSRNWSRNFWYQILPTKFRSKVSDCKIPISFPRQFRD